MTDRAMIDAVNRFWFEELKPEDWFKKSEERDETIKQRFAAIYDRLREGVPASWLETPDGYVAAIVVLDQFPRNMFRGEKRSFATDPLALELAKQAIANGIDAQAATDQAMGSLSAVRAFRRCSRPSAMHRADDGSGNPVALDWALRHKAVFDRFGRFPHRNAILGRTSTDDEAEFLKQPGSSF